VRETHTSFEDDISAIPPALKKSGLMSTSAQDGKI